MGNGSEEAQPETGRPGRRQASQRRSWGNQVERKDSQEEYCRKTIRKMGKWKRQEGELVWVSGFSNWGMLPRHILASQL